MTDTTKLLDGFEDWLAKWEKTMGEKHLFHDVAAFARIGASVMPRPIEGAPKDGAKILLMGNGPGFWATEGAWVGHASEWRDATSFTFKLVEPHSWLPLSALQVKP